VKVSATTSVSLGSPREGGKEGKKVYNVTLTVTKLFVKGTLLGLTHTSELPFVDKQAAQQWVDSVSAKSGLDLDFVVADYSIKEKPAIPETFELGDIISFGWTDGYADGTIVQVHLDGTVDVSRVYVHISDMVTTGSEKGSSAVTSFIGHEVVKKVDPIRGGLRILRKCSKPLL